MRNNLLKLSLLTSSDIKLQMHMWNYPIFNIEWMFLNDCGVMLLANLFIFGFLNLKIFKCLFLFNNMTQIFSVVILLKMSLIKPYVSWFISICVKNKTIIIRFPRQFFNYAFFFVAVFLFKMQLKRLTVW